MKAGRSACITTSGGNGATGWIALGEKYRTEVERQI